MSDELKETAPDEVRIEPVQETPEEAKTEAVAEVTAATAEPAKPAKSGAVRGMMANFGLGLFIGVVAIGMIAVGIMTYGAYRRGWTGPSETIVRGLNLPAASVNGTEISYRSFTDDLATARQVYAKAVASGQAQSVPDEATLRHSVMDRLVENAVLEQEARRLGVKVTSEDLDAEYKKIAAETEGEDPAKIIQDTYGWTVDEFKQKAMRPYFLAQKIKEALSNEPAGVADSEKRAQAALERIKKGEDFAKVAEEVSEDTANAKNGGDLGFFSREVMVKEFADAAFALKKGEVSQQLVRTSFGFHIIKVTDVKTDDKGAVSEVKASHILIRLPDAEAKLQEIIKKAGDKATYYVKFGDEGQAAKAEDQATVPTEVAE